MTTENCPKLAQLVEQLGEAINTQKRIAADESRTTEERLSADEQMAKALEAMRTHKAEHHCEMAEPQESVA